MASQDSHPSNHMNMTVPEYTLQFDNALICLVRQLHYTVSC